MLSQEELQNLSQQAEHDAQTTRRNKYLADNGFDPNNLLKNYNLNVWVARAVFVGSLIISFMLGPKYILLIMPGSTITIGLVFLWINWKRRRYHQKLRKVNSKFFNKERHH